MTALRWLPSLSIGITLAGAYIVSLTGSTGWWGLNYLTFLSGGWSIAFVLLALAVIGLSVTGDSSGRLGKSLARLDDIVFGSRQYPMIVVAVAAVILFWLLRMPTHFLGDGYEWLGNLGRGEGYIHKWTEAGSTYLVRWLQYLQGGFTKETALVSFQILSVLSGGLAVYAGIGLIGLIAQAIPARLIASGTLLFSATLLLYFGYVEFYPLTWSFVLLYFYSVLRYLTGRGRFWVVALTYFLALVMHVQVVILLVGLIFLLIRSVQRRRWRHRLWLACGFVALIGFATAVYLYHIRIDVRVLILPLFEGRGFARDYTVVSWQHWFDLIQLTLMVFPGIIVLMSGLLVIRSSSRGDEISRFLVFSSAGSLTYLFLYGAAITMARDWDVMALGLLPPVLWIVRRVSRANWPFSSNSALGYLLLCGLMTVTFLAVQLQTRPAIERYQSLLNRRHRSSWLVLTEYYRDHGDRQRRTELLQQVDDLFPEYVQERRAKQLLSQRQHEDARQIAETLCRRYPHNPDFLLLLATVYNRLGRYKEAAPLYRDAIHLRPYYAVPKFGYGELLLRQNKPQEAIPLLEEARQDDPSIEPIMTFLGLAYARAGHSQRAAAIADTMLANNPNSPDGHLVYVEIGVVKGDLESARQHYQAFLKHGRDRSDYDSIRDRFKYLLE